MSVRSLQEHIDSLLNKGVVQPKVNGVPSPDVETASVLESFALAMMLQPRAALYAGYLAKNGLVVAIDQEISTIETLKSAINDLGNTTFAIKDIKSLRRAQASMLQLTTQGQVSSESSAFERFDVAVNDFLDKQLAKNIKRPGATEMVRPGEEAGLDLPTDLAAVKDAHSDLLDRLYSLTVGVVNFLTTPFSSLVGGNAVYRVKKDLDSIITEIEEDESGAQSRDAAVRLITGRAAIRILGSKVEIQPLVVDTALKLPPDQLLSGKSAPAVASATTSIGPYVMPSGSLSMTVDSQTVSTSLLNQAANAASVLSDVVVFPVSIPANYHLFLRMEATSGLTWTPGAIGTTYEGTFEETTLGKGWYKDEAGSYFKNVKVTLNTGATITPPSGPTDGAPRSVTLTNLLTAINLALGITGPEQPSTIGSATEFLTGTNRVLIIASEPKIQRLSIARDFLVMEAQSDGSAPSTGATVFFPRIYNNSAHAEVGFPFHQTGEKGSTPARRIFDALQFLFSSLATFVFNAEESITMATIIDSPGVTLSFTGSSVPLLAVLGLSETYLATSPTVSLQGEEGVVSPIDIIDIGDFFESSTGTGNIQSLTAASFTLDSALATFSGGISITSALYLVWTEIESQVRGFLNSWLEGPFAKDLSSLDQLIAILIGSPTSPRRSEALDLLDSLKTELQTLRTLVTTTQATLPTGSATKERSVINNIISTFTERRFDRALDFLLRCKLQEIFEFNWQTASFSGNLMKAAEGIAQSDVKFPNTIEDEGFDVPGLRDVRR